MKTVEELRDQLGLTDDAAAELHAELEERERIFSAQRKYRSEMWARLGDNFEGDGYDR